MKLIVGLGNPGKEYENTRHNSGYRALDHLCAKFPALKSRRKFNAAVFEIFVNGEKVILMKPETFMNDSGKAVREARDYYDIAESDILIIHDDMDLPTGKLRLREKGSSGGHKGMASIIASLHTDQISRIRIGVGHSALGNHDIVPDWVLSSVPKEEADLLARAEEQAAEAAFQSLSEPFAKVMALFNKTEKNSEETDHQ